MVGRVMPDSGPGLDLLFGMLASKRPRRFDLKGRDVRWEALEHT